MVTLSVIALSPWFEPPRRGFLERSSQLAGH
jgi:hypothetical protein